MPTPPRTSLLRRLIGLPKRAPVQDDDAGDMGTAIGLDYSLDQTPRSSKPLPASKSVTSSLRAKRPSAY